MDIYAFWTAVLRQDREAIRSYFAPDAYVNWHCSNEHFTVEEFIQANCDYPGQWDGEIQRLEQTGDLTISVTHVYTRDRALSFHVTSFIKSRDGKILSVDEYWGNDGPAPQWRQDMHIGRAIQ